MKSISNRPVIWREAFSDQKTGISLALHKLIWNYAIFSVSSKIVKITAINPERHNRINKPFFDLLSNGYWIDFLVGVRKLVDRYPIDSKNGVFSLRSVLEDIEKYQSSLTRKFYVEFIHGAVYDLEHLETMEYNSLIANGGLPRWGNPALIKSKWAHESFDVLARNSAKERTEDDLINPAFFTDLQTKLDKVENIRAYVNSHIVHAGHAQSRENKDLKNFNIINANEALSNLTAITNILAINFGSDGGYDLPVFQGDIFAGLTLPLIDNEDLPELNEFWEELSIDIGGWADGSN